MFPCRHHAEPLILLPRPTWLHSDHTLLFCFHIYDTHAAIYVGSACYTYDNLVGCSPGKCLAAILFSVNKVMWLEYIVYWLFCNEYLNLFSWSYVQKRQATQLIINLPYCGDNFVVRYNFFVLYNILSLECVHFGPSYVCGRFWLVPQLDAHMVHIIILYTVHYTCVIC